MIHKRIWGTLTLTSLVLISTMNLSPALSAPIDSHSSHNSTIQQRPTLEESQKNIKQSGDQGYTEKSTDRFVVQFKKDVSQDTKKKIVQRVDDTSSVVDDAKIVKGTVGENASVVAVDDKLGVKEQSEVVKVLEKDDKVVSVEPDLIVHRATAGVPATPNDTSFGSQWNLQAINAPHAWSMATGKGITIGITDTGITSHPELDNKLVQGYDFVSSGYDRDSIPGRDAYPVDPGVLSSAENWHGTHVAGIAAAQANNRQGIAGVAPEANIEMARSLGVGGSGYQSDIADSITWLSGGVVAGVPKNQNPVNVINASLSWNSDTCPTVMKNAIDSAHSRNVPVVVAAGNTGTNADYSTPSNCLGAIVVGATAQNNIFVGYSNWGNMLDIVAPGGAVNAGQIYSTLNTGFYSQIAPTYGYLNGTSMASPHIAGVIAMMKQRDPNLGVEQIRTILQNTGTMTPSGYKIANAQKAVASIDPINPPSKKPVVRNEFKNFYDKNGGINKFGYPTINEKNTKENGKVQNFSKGYSLYYSPKTGVHSMKWSNDIPSVFAKNGYENNWGYPMTEETSTVGNSAYQTFYASWNNKKTTVVWNAKSGSHYLYENSGIGSYWVSHGKENKIGVPINEEIGLKNGAYQSFRSTDGKWLLTNVLWSPSTGSHLIKEYGGIGRKWSSLNREHGKLGYPTSDEYWKGTHVQQTFTGGTIDWDSKTKKVTVTYKK